jgi:dihydroneopterin aldolase
MTIHIEALTFEVIIGLLDFERERPQHIMIDMTIGYPYVEGEFIDYAIVVEKTKQHMHQHKYKLLEEALVGLETYLRSLYPSISTLKLKITKPDILKECFVALSNE